MDPFHEHLLVRAATIDELLSDDFLTVTGQQRDADTAATRLAAWCRASASGDWLLFGRRLKRDGLAMDAVLARFSGARRNPAAGIPAWLDDAIWVEAALQGDGYTGTTEAPVAALPFDDLLMPVVLEADARLWTDVGEAAGANLDAAGRTSLRRLLLATLSELCAPALYERFVKARADGATARYEKFCGDMRAGGFRRLFAERPVLLRLLAALTRQWLDASSEFLVRLAADLDAVRRELMNTRAPSRVSGIEGGLSDPHNGGRAVLIVAFADGARVVYKPKDMRADATWQALVARLNTAGAPIDLRAMRTLARDGYGWTEFVEHAGCADAEGCRRFFRRAGAWLALFHCFAATDLHQENLIAAGDHPVPIDLETVLQAAVEEDNGTDAVEAAKAIVANSVVAVGLLPAYGKAAGNEVYVVGGVAGDWAAGTKRVWHHVNTDHMRPTVEAEPGKPTANLPHVDGRYARLGDHIADFVAGFDEYLRFLRAQSRGADWGALFDGFVGLPVRRVIRPTQFYYMLLQRLRDDRRMTDGIAWSAQADFIARLADWGSDREPAWALQRSERAALTELNVPHFVLASDDTAIILTGDVPVPVAKASGLERARARIRNLDESEIAWQVDVIRENTRSLSNSAGEAAAGTATTLPISGAPSTASPMDFMAEADRIAAEIAVQAVRREEGAAWIGLGWLINSEVSQLTVLGPDLYNGMSGIALFLAAQASVTGNATSAELARAAVAPIRRDLKSRGAARLARSLGIGGATGLGSIVYALAGMGSLLRDDSLMADALGAVALFSDDLIAADRQLDVIGGSAGAILALLRLHRDTGADDVLHCAVRCGEHLLAQPRVGEAGRRSWKGLTHGSQPLNGMSHGAAGFAYALGSLASATGREDFAAAAGECIAFENATYDAAHANWPDFRDTEPFWGYFRWCHGAVGIGLARIAMARRAGAAHTELAADIRHALAGATGAWPGTVDTLCCGTLGSIELFDEAGTLPGQEELRRLAAQRLTEVLSSAADAGDYRWNGGARRFNLGLFRGLAGVGYTCLRRTVPSLPNVLIWD